MSLRGSVAAWVGPATVAGLASGGWVLARNAGAGFDWQAPAILVGVPVAALALGGALLGATLVLVASLGALPALRRPSAHAAAASFLSILWLANNSGRALDLTGALRVPAAAAIAALAAWAAARIAASAAARPVGRALASIAFVGSVAAAAAFASLAPRRARAPDETARRADARDFVPRFDPLPAPPERTAVQGRVVVLGLDGATWDRIDPLIAAGRLPNFARLASEGATARLKTFKPTLSAPIWTTIATGKPPTVHGIRRHYSHQVPFLRTTNLRLGPGMGPLGDLLVARRLLRVLPVSSNLRRCKALWNIGSEAGLKVAMLGWWASWPVEPVANGWIVSEVASTSRLKELVDRGKAANFEVEAVTHPPVLLGELAPLERSPESVTREDLAKFLPVDDEVWREFLDRHEYDWEDPLTVFRATYLKDLFFVDAALAIDAAHRPDLLLSYLKGIDVFGHVFWRYSAKEALEEGEDPRLVARYRGCVDRAYEWTDGLLGRYLERLGPDDTIVVLSDHGWEREGRRKYAHHEAPDGILAVFGAQAKKGARIENAHVLDVAPTLLHLVGLPQGDDMPGRVLLDALSSAHPARSIPTWETRRFGSTDAIEMLGAEDRERELRALGYVR